MVDERAAWAIQSLYENSSTRGDLTDSEAETLLQWGESQVRRLAASGIDDAAFDEAVGQLRRLLRRINRLAAQREYLPPEDQAAALNGIAEHAAAIGLPVLPEKQEQFLNQPRAFASPNVHANVHALIDLVSSRNENPL